MTPTDGTMDPAAPAVRPPQPDTPDRLAATLAAVQARMDEAHQASWPTTVRLTAAVAALTGLTAAHAIQGEPRDGLGTPGGLAGLTTTAAAAAAAASLALRPMHRPPAPAAAAPALLLLLPLLSALPTWPGILWNSDDPIPLAIHQGCFERAVALAVPGTALTLWLDRSPAPSRDRRLAAAAAGGLAAFASLMVTCVLVDPLHLLLSHAAPGLIVAAGLLAHAIARR